MDREELAIQTEELLAEYYKEATEYDGITPVRGKQYSEKMAPLLSQWVSGWRNNPNRTTNPYPEPGANRIHTAGHCQACAMAHSVPEANRLNGVSTPEYGAMIRRTEGQEDPLVQEPKS